MSSIALGRRAPSPEVCEIRARLSYLASILRTVEAGERELVDRALSTARGRQQYHAALDLFVLLESEIAAMLKALD